MSKYMETEWIVVEEESTYDIEYQNEDGGGFILSINKAFPEAKAVANAISAIPDMLVVCHNLAATMAVDLAIKKLSVSEDSMCRGMSVILAGIQRQAKIAENKAKEN